MLELKRRPCKIGPSANMRRKKHGEENVPAVDIPITMLIERHELSNLLNDSEADRALFRERPGDRFPEVAFEDFDSIQLKPKFEKSQVTLWLGVQDKQIVLAGVTLAKLWITPLPGGMTSLDFKVQSDYEDAIGSIFHFLDGEAHCSVKIGSRVVLGEEQGEMDLEVNAESVPGEDDPDEDFDPDEDADEPVDDATIAALATKTGKRKARKPRPASAPH